MKFLRRSILTLLIIAVPMGVALQFWPLPERLTHTPYATLMLDRNDRLLGARIAADEQWRFVPVEVLPDKYRRALLSYEDKRFFAHPGVDPLAIARAAWLNARAGRVVSGGSTLTMQLARLLRDDPPRTL
ncbi:MAG: transglycosylase domain-containing protein, partial [Alcanivorax sp.]